MMMKWPIFLTIKFSLHYSFFFVRQGIWKNSHTYTIKMISFVRDHSHVFFIIMQIDIYIHTFVRKDKSIKQTSKASRLQILLKWNMINGHCHEQSLPKGVPFEDYRPPNWDEFFMLKVYLTGRKKMNLSIDLDVSFCFSSKIQRSSNENRCSTRTRSTWFSFRIQWSSRR